MSEIPSVLLKIRDRKVEEVDRLRQSGKRIDYESIAKNQPPTRGFYHAISKAEFKPAPNLIAEFKITSPSNQRKGNPDFRPGANPEEIARTYEQCGASAMSVLTDYQGFKGQLTHLQRIKNVVDLPLLRKDFIIDPIQIYESRIFGADAILLISAILKPAQIREYIDIADSLDMDCLVESHNKEELKKSIQGGAKIYGINNRDLHTFDIDISTTLDLLHLVPKACPVVTESGIHTYEDVKKLSDYRINAMLVGTSLMKADNIEHKIYELQGK